MIHRLLCGTAALVWASASWAQGTTAAPATTLDPIRVEADAIATSAEQAIAAKRAAPNTVTVIEAEQLNQFGDQPLGDALRRLPGVTFPGGNRARDVQLRGIGVEYTQVLLNGRPLVDGNSKRSVQVDRIPSSLVERIEIVRAPLASQDGQGAAGTLNIVLKNQNFAARSEAGAGLGYLEENGWLGDATILHAQEVGAFRLVVSGGVQRQRRNESKDTLNFTGAGAANGGTLEDNTRSFHQFNFTPSLEYHPNEDNTFRLEPSYLHTTEIRNDVSGTLNANHVGVGVREFELRERTRENYGLFGEWRHSLSDWTDVVGSVDYQSAVEDTHRDATRYTAAGIVNRRRHRTEDIQMQRYSPSFRIEHALGMHELSLGGNYSHASRIEGNSEITNGVGALPNGARSYEVIEDRASAFVQGQFQLGSADRLTLGLRAEQAETETRDAVNVSTTRDSVFLLPSLNYVHSFPTATDFRVGIGRTVRRPDLRELTPTVTTAAGTLASPDTGGNPNLEPEAIWGADVGVDQYFYGNRGIVGFNVFARRFSDKIENVTALEGARFVARGQNVGDGRMYGLEIEGRLPLDAISLRDVTLWANATRIAAEVDAAATGETRRFLDQHDYVANIGLDWFIPALRTTLGGAINMVSGYNQTHRTTAGTILNADVSSAVRFDLSARTDLTDSISLNLSALNLFAGDEKRVDRTYNAAGVLTAYSTTDEPTYRTVYLRMNVKF